MSDLEDKAKPLIAPMTRAEPHEFTTWAEYALVATWGYKTALMLSLTVRQEHRFVPDEEFKFLYEHRLPPPNVFIWLATYIWGAESKLRTGWSKPQRLIFDTGREKRHGYVMAFNVGALVFQIASDPFGGYLRRAAERREDTFLKIWPLPVEKKRWLTKNRLTEALLDELGEARVFTTRPPPSQD